MRARREEKDSDERPSPIARLNEISDHLAKASAEFKKIADAAKPLFDSLDETQKRHFGPLLRSLRGEGADGGCGEIDVAEVLGGATAPPAHPEQATTTIYSFQGVTGGGADYFQRPVYETATFLVIFDAASSTIAIRRLGATDFDFASTIPSSQVAQWLADAGATRPMP